MGGTTSNTTIQAPAPPAPPSVTSSLEDYIKNVPALFQTAQQYQPQFAQLQQQISQQTSPLTAGLQETLAGQAIEGIQGDVPDFVREEYLDNMRGQLGQNVASPIGADDISRKLRAQQFQFKSANQNLALSLAGRQQLVQPPSQEQLLGGFNTGQALGFNQGVFGTQAGMYGQQANMATQQAAINQRGNAANSAFWGDIVGGGIGALGSGYGGYLGGR